MTSKSAPSRAEKNAANRTRYASDPVYRAKVLAYQKDYRKRRVSTPELREKWTRFNRARYAKPEYRQRLQEWRKKNRLSEKARWMHRYGITPADYDRMLKAQRGLCALCGEPPGPKTRYGKLHIDHNHETGEVRGLLCFLCNHGLGGYERLVKVCGLDAVQRYLEGWPQAELLEGITA